LISGYGILADKQYLYYNGDSGVGPNGYSSTLFQSYLNQAGRDSVTGGPCTDAQGVCNIKFAGNRPVSSAILIIQGISFAIMTLFFTSIGSCADYGSWNKWILIVATGKYNFTSTRDARHFEIPSNFSLDPSLVTQADSSDLLGFPIRLDGHYQCISMAIGHRSLSAWIHFIRSHTCVLRFDLPPIGQEYSKDKRC